MRATRFVLARLRLPTKRLGEEAIQLMKNVPCRYPTTICDGLGMAGIQWRKLGRVNLVTAKRTTSQPRVIDKGQKPADRSLRHCVSFPPPVLAHGVARWWLGPHASVLPVSDVESALRQLVARQQLREESLSDGTTLYSNNAKYEPEP